MRSWFRDGFYAGAGVALALGIYLLWLWGAEHQVRLHTDHLLRTMENRDWAKLATFLADDYQDQWGQDRAMVLQRARGVFGYLRGIHLVPGYAIVQAASGQASWHARVTIEGDNGDLATMVKERVNSLATPFTLEWRRQSSKPWDWKLVRVSNPSLDIPATGFE